MLILNHKANFKLKEIKKYERAIRKYNVVIMPELCYLPLFNKGKYILGAQDISEFDKKNITGEINANSLKSLNVKYALIGHSDRSIYKKENESTIKNKLNECKNNDIIPLCCIGEDDTIDIKRKIDLYLQNVEQLTVIYEPIYNIGTREPNLSIIEERIDLIKDYIKTNYNKEIDVIYGGGVNENNIDYLNSIKNIDGLIISTSSLDLTQLKIIYDKTKK